MYTHCQRVLIANTFNLRRENKAAVKIINLLNLTPPPAHQKHNTKRSPKGTKKLQYGLNKD